MSKDLMRQHIHSLNSLLADGDLPILQAGLVFIRNWQIQERKYGSNRYRFIVENVRKEQNVFLQAIGEQLLSVFSHFGSSLPVVLGIEDPFWALRRKIEFCDEEIVWLLQWIGFKPWEDEGMIGRIKGEFLRRFLPLGRPRKSRRVLRKKLRELWGFVKGYEYSQVEWTWELDCCLMRVCREFGTVEERIFAVIGWCYVNDLRWRSEARILERVKVLGCNGVGGIGKEEKSEEWEIVRGRPESLGMFKSSRRKSI